MSESKPRLRRRSKPITEQKFQISIFGECVVVVARGIKPAQWLSARVACTERHANLIIAGKRKPSARAVHAVNSAFFE